MTINSELVVVAQQSVDGKQYKIVDNRHVPYISSTEYLTATVINSTVLLYSPFSRRHIGKTIYVVNAGVIEIWQFIGGIQNVNLVKVFPQTFSGGGGTGTNLPLPLFANNNAAIAGGLVENDLYHLPYLTPGGFYPVAWVGPFVQEYTTFILNSFLDCSVITNTSITYNLIHTLTGVTYSYTLTRPNTSTPWSNQIITIPQGNYTWNSIINV